MKASSVPEIALNPSNEHGGHYFMSLYSGRRLHSYEWRELPIDEDVVERVEVLSELEQAPDMKKGHLIFTWKQHVLSDMGSYEEDDIDISNVHGGEDDTVLDEDNEDNDEETVGDDLVIDKENDEMPLNFEE